MKRMMQIIDLAVMLLAALPVISCHPLEEEDIPELSVSIYIPDIVATKAEIGSVGALPSEKRFTSLQLWVFFHGGTRDGILVGYKGFTSDQLVETGLSYFAVTRFAMPLSPEKFTLLSQDNTKVDVYAVANAASATDIALGEETSRSVLDTITLHGNKFGVSSLTMAVPTAGLPMSGVLKEASVTGGYPVLNVSTVTLTRTVSKIRFVFCQQGTPASDTSPAEPSNATCVVDSITFEGTDFQIATAEKLFTEYPFDFVGYTPLTATLPGDGGVLKQNADITVCANPEDLLFRSTGHETESAREYESRLDSAIDASSQVGPLYIRETDKAISGTIFYSTGGEAQQPVHFSMQVDDALPRNHSWILYAYFAEETKTLQFKIVVLPWDKSSYSYGMNFSTSTSSMVNVVRRFTIEADTTMFTKHRNDDGYYDIYFWHTIGDPPDEQTNIIKGDILIDAPVGQKLHIVPVAGVKEGYTQIDDIFSVRRRGTVDDKTATIYPNYEHPELGRTEDCKIEFEISCNPDGHTAEELEGNYIDIHFCVEIGSGDNVRWIDVDSESRDFYRIYLKQDWKHWENW